MSARAANPARARRPEPATVMFARQVKPGHELEYAALAQAMIDASEEVPGQLAATMLHEDDSTLYTLIYSFTDQPSLRTWLESPRRQQLLERADQIADVHTELPSLTGLETWFALPHRPTITPPPRWKMWLVSLLAIYPFVVAFQALLVPSIKAWPLLLRSALLPLTLLTLMTFVVMPVVTRIAEPWLSPSRENGAKLDVP